MTTEDPPEEGQSVGVEREELLEAAALARKFQARIARELGIETSLSGSGDIPPPRTPSVARFYETTCLDVPGSGAAMQIISFPQRPERVAAWQIEDQDVRYWYTSATAVAGQLGLDMVRDVDEPRLLVAAIVYTRPDHSPSYDRQLEEYEHTYVADEFAKRDFPKFAEFVARNDYRLVLFATRMAEEPLVPVEASPLHAESAAKLMGSAGSSAALGWVAGIHDPWLLIVTPLTVVLMGAATGIATGLHEGLRRNVVRWLTGTDPGAEGEDSPAEADKSAPEAE